MNTIEQIIFSIISVIAVLATFDFVVFRFKAAPTRAYFAKGFWIIGMLCVMALVYWTINGMKFI